MLKVLRHGEWGKSAGVETGLMYLAPVGSRGYGMRRKTGDVALEHS